MILFCVSEERGTLSVNSFAVLKVYLNTSVIKFQQYLYFIGVPFIINLHILGMMIKLHHTDEERKYPNRLMHDFFSYFIIYI